MSEKINSVEVDLAEDVAQGNYANLAIISHSPTEFIIDFATMLPGMSKAKVNNRIIVTPEHAKRLFRSLQDNIARYEGRFGEISNTDGTTHQGQSTERASMFEITPKIGEA